MAKSLYGLRQAPRPWFAKLSSKLCDYGFIHSYADYSLFAYRKGTVFMALLVYVDDIVLASNDSDACSEFKSYLHSCFSIKHLGPLKYFLELKVARSPKGISLSQRKHALEIVDDCDLLSAKPSDFTMEENHQLALATGSYLQDARSYRRLVGRLIFLTITCPDLSYAVHILSQFMQAPREEHMNVV